jgi:hypothetical protein
MALEFNEDHHVILSEAKETVPAWLGARGGEPEHPVPHQRRIANLAVSTTHRLNAV